MYKTECSVSPCEPPEGGVVIGHCDVKTLIVVSNTKYSFLDWLLLCYIEIVKDFSLKTISTLLMCKRNWSKRIFEQITKHKPGQKLCFKRVWLGKGVYAFQAVFKNLLKNNIQQNELVTITVVK